MNKLIPVFICLLLSFAGCKGDQEIGNSRYSILDQLFKEHEYLRKPITEAMKDNRVTEAEYDRIHQIHSDRLEKEQREDWAEQFRATKEKFKNTVENQPAK